MFNDCLIMAGGSGTRLWPASSSRLPKQFLQAAKGKSFFSLALERALTVSENVIVIAGKTHVPHVITDASKLDAAEKKRIVVIGEPAAKNTAAAIACAIVFSSLKKRGIESGSSKDMLVLTSDHIIKPLKMFKSAAMTALKAASDNTLVVFGIVPSRPETGYGYIETASASSLQNQKKNVFAVAAFHEKPDFENAKKYTESGRFFWNSGMFAFNVNFMADQFNTCANDVMEPFKKLKEPKKTDYTVSKGIKILSSWKGLDTAYKKTKSISFDYAVAEKCGKRAMVYADFDWIDIGNWEEYAKLRSGNGGISGSQVFRSGSDGCFVDSDIPVALAGVEDLIIVIRSGKNGETASALITKKGQTQKVRDITTIIKDAGRQDLL